MLTFSQHKLYRFKLIDRSALILRDFAKAPNWFILRAMSAVNDPTFVIAVRLPNWVGDVCMSLPCLQWLNDQGHELVIFGRPWAKPLVQQFNPSAFVALSGSFGADLKTVKQFRSTQRQITHGLILPDSLSSAALFRLAGINSAGHRHDGRSLLLKWPVPKPNAGLHASQKWWHLVKESAMRWALPTPPTQAPRVSLAISAIDSQAASQSIDAANLTGKSFILLAPTATGLHKGQVKVWPHFASLSKALVEMGHQLVICPPPNEVAQAQALAPGATLITPLNLGGFAALAKRSALVICNDSGVSHLAAVAGATQITLIGVTEPSHSGPVSDSAIVMGQMGQWPSLKAVIDVVADQVAVIADPNNIGSV
jgi:heptosyltransferase II